MTFSIFQYRILLDREFRPVMYLLGGGIFLLIMAIIGFQQPLITLLLALGVLSLPFIDFPKQINAGLIRFDDDAIIINKTAIKLSAIKFIEINYGDYKYNTSFLIMLRIDNGLNKIRIVTSKEDYTYLLLSTKDDTKFFKSYKKLLKDNNVPCQIRIGLFA